MKICNQIVITILCAITCSYGVEAQNNFFDDAGANKLIRSNARRVITPENFRTVGANTIQLQTFLWSLPSERNVDRRTAPVISLPMPDGTLADFHVWESSIQEAGLEAKYPGIKTFAGQGIDDPYATIRFDYTSFGFHAQILSVNGNVYIDPYARGDIDHYISYYGTENKRTDRFVCELKENAILNRTTNVLAGPCRGTQLYSYRLAVACTGEYAVAVGGTTAALLHSAIVTTVNRVDGVYESEVAIRMVLIANNNLVEYLNAGTDPFNGNNNAGTLINESQTVITSVIGSANFDIGHTFSTGGGGLAGLGVVCIAGQKARGITGSPNPVGDNYDIDYVAHEMGHQFGGDHSFNSTTSNCGGGNRNASTAYEVGSGTTIMAYAGICTTDDIQLHSDAFFHTVSFDEISNYVEAGGGSCKVAIPTGNTLPVITSMNNNLANIPLNTPFTLTGTATDADGDPITYCWEEWDLGTGGAWNNGANSTTAPLFRPRPPKVSGSRTFPDMAVILAGYPANPAVQNLGGLKGETRSLVARAIKFRLTVRDNRAGGSGVVTGGNGCQLPATFQVNTIAATGPFIVNIPNGGESYAGNSSQTVTWNVAGTNAAPINTANVKITLSTDGGLTFPTTLLASTANDGSELVTIPNIATTTARVKVEAEGNVYFDISNANFTIIALVSGFSFNATTATTIGCGGPTTAAVTLGTTANGSFVTPIVLTATAGVPVGTTVTFAPNPLAPGSATTVTLNNANTLANGTYNITVTGTAGAEIQTAVVTFIVSAGAGPVITSQPANATLCEGGNATFSVTATAATGYQWQVNTGAGFTDIPLAITSTYMATAVTAGQNGYLYQVIVTGLCNTTTSASATLTVQTAPAITTQPANTTACVGTNATLTVAATGTNLTYQWQTSAAGCAGPWTPIPGATTNSYTVVGITLANDNTGYQVVISGTCAPSVTSNCALLTVGNAAGITNQPIDVTACEGTNAVFNVTATGSVSSYQWQVNTGSGFTDIAGANTNTLTLNAVTVAMTGYQYLVNVFSCTAIPIVSNTVTLTVNSLATISAQPANSTVCLGSNASFGVTAAGTGISYQWQYAASCAGPFTNITGATNSTYDLTNVTLADAGAYQVVVTGTCNTVTSTCASLVVNSPVTISAQPASVDICLPINTTSFTVTAAGTGLTYQWQVSTDGGATWTNITGETNATLNLTGLTASMNGYQYQVVLNGTCTTDLNSAAAILAVNSPVNITQQPTDQLSCAGSAASFTVTATGSTITYQWQMSVGGGPFVNVPNAAPFSGVTTNTLNISPITTVLNGYVFQVIVSGVPCGSVTSDPATLTANALPVVVLTAASYSAINPYIRTTLYTTVSPAGTDYVYTWYRDNVVTSQTGDRFNVTVDDLGVYDVVVTDTVTGCSSNRSNTAEIKFAISDQVFIYPNPTSGQFQVRYYSSSTSTSYGLSVYDSKGARVYNRTYPITSAYTRMDVNLDNASSGIYMVEVKDANGKRLATGKLIVR
ncbi:MAG: reprolysin-like metallopeptidase [Ferruginibacter sp.]